MADNKSNYECKRKEVFERFQEQPGQLPKLFFFVLLLLAYYKLITAAFMDPQRFLIS